jgi:hypothetical protein
MVVHRCFLDLTSQIQDWRVVQIQERLIEREIALAPDVATLEESPFLNAFFQQLTKTNEARRCINYLFKYKCERIDLSFLTMKNLQKIYLKYAEIHD